MSADLNVHTDFDFDSLQRMLQADKDDALFDAIVNAPFVNPLPAVLIFLGIVVLLQVNGKTETIDRIALSQTEQARLTTEVSVTPFKEIKIPYAFHENIIAEAIHSGKPQDTIDWKFLFNPAMPPEQARINQANAGISYSAVYPLKSRDGGALIFSFYQFRIDNGDKQREFMERYTKLVDEALARKS